MEGLIISRSSSRGEPEGNREPWVGSDSLGRVPSTNIPTNGNGAKVALFARKRGRFANKGRGGAERKIEKLGFSIRPKIRFA